MKKDVIKIRGARQHNLKDVNIDIPKNTLVAFSGVSGSGKSSLAFDTIYAEGQRRYVESLSSYARQFLGVMAKPDVDLIEGLSPAISIDQKTVSHNPRSTVGTVTEIYDYLRLLFARIGHPHCPICGDEIAILSLDQIVTKVIENIKKVLQSKHNVRFFILSPVVKDRKGEFSTLFENLKAKGFKRIRVDGEYKNLDEDFVLIKTNKHKIEVVTDKLSLTTSDFKEKVFQKNFSGRLTDSISQALKLSDGLVILTMVNDASFEFPDKPTETVDYLFSENFSCPKDNISLPEIEPRTFSFNSPHGACVNCAGIGSILKVDPNLIIASELSIKEGGIIPFSSIFEHDTWFSRLILKVCNEAGIDVSLPIKELPPDKYALLLNGTGDKIYQVEGTNKYGKHTSIYEKFIGIVPELERRYVGTSSDYIRGSIERYMVPKVCEACHGKRLKEESLSIIINQKSIFEVCELSIVLCLRWVKDLLTSNILNDREKQIAFPILKEIIARLTFLTDVGLDYLSLGRSAQTLAGGEAQRIRLASQIGSGLTGVLYVLDEPTIGLHPKDNEKLINTLKKMRNLGNTIIIVEHDRDVLESADYIFDFGPGGGKKGGLVVAQGNTKSLKKNPQSVTGAYLADQKKIEFNDFLRPFKNGEIVLSGASQYNLKNITARFQIGKLNVVTGVSGSGKSTLVVETLYHALAKALNPYHKQKPGIHLGLEGIQEIQKTILIDQSPIGRTPRSNPATYTKVFDLIRDVFANTKEARSLGFNKGRFSFNVKGGRCEACEGQGEVKIEMQFMPDIWVDCEICKGARYNTQTLEVTYKGKNIADILKLNVSEAHEFFHIFKNITRKLDTLLAVGLEYIELGQSATTLSGGEAQRIKIAAELSKISRGDTVYILDEPTTGLHFADLERLLFVLKKLVEKGNTVIVIEHNMDVIKNADWIIDLGPAGGEAGGNIVGSGSPREIAKNKKSYTGRYLNAILEK